MKKPPETLPTAIDGHRVLIRRLRPSDAEAYYQHVRDKEVVRWTLEIPHPYPRSEATRVVNRARREWNAGREYNFGVELNKNGELLGEVRLLNVDWEHECALLAYWLGKAHWRQGYKTEAARLAVRFGFESLGLHRIEAYVFDKNQASARVLEKSGLQLEGRFRQRFLRYGHRHDRLQYGILRQEYERIKDGW